MPMILVTADLGNSRLKLAAWEQARDSPGTAIHGAPAPVSLDAEREEEGLPAWFDSLRDFEPRGEIRCALVSVAGTRRRERVARLLERASGAPPATPAHGLEIRCHTPESVGQDRLFAARGALARLGRSCIVIDAGTALTVDAVLAEGGGVFLGGAIAPGPTLLASSMAAGAARLPEVVPETGVRALGGDTTEAIRAGVAVGFRGAAHALVEAVSREAALSAAPLILTGGARAFLLEPASAFARPVTEVEELVSYGMLAALSSQRFVERNAETGPA